MHRPRFELLIPLLLLGAACSDVSAPAAKMRAASLPRFSISDGAHGGSTRLYFLPPLVPQPTFSGTFDPTAFGPGSSDQVYVCVLAGAQCGSRVATFVAGTGPSGVHMNPTTESYQVSWQTQFQQPALDLSQTYRIVVRVNNADVGYADAIPVPNSGPSSTVDRSKFVVIRVGTVAQIAFRLETTASPPPPTGMTDVLANNLYSCSLAGTGQVFCWGSQGGGTPPDYVWGATPTQIAGSWQFIALTGHDGGHNCALDQAHLAYCWGANGWGEIGDGTSGNYVLTPTAVSGGLVFASITASGNYTCGLTLAGAAYCWGYNFWGQLGNGSSGWTPSLTPAPVSGGLPFTSIDAGDEDACALTSSGAAYCWGDNSLFEIGDGTSTQRLVPTPVSGGLQFASLAVGNGYACGLAASGAAYCWGSNSIGMLGDGTLTTRPTPQPVVGGLSFSRLSASSDHTCGVTVAGAAYCWGANYFGQLGDGTTIPTLSPVAVVGGLTFATISVGDADTCGATTSGSVYCWGGNSVGQLGDGTATNRLVPTLITFP